MDIKFRQQKQHALKKLSTAKGRGEVDLDMLPLIDCINSLENYYTTSSCAGRINLFVDVGNKKDSYWLGKWHRKITFEDVSEALKNIPAKGVIWFKQEPTIIHINCKTIEDAVKLVDLSRNTGYKKVCILSWKDNRIIVEVNGTERIDAPIAVNGEMIAGGDYIKKLIEIANTKFDYGMRRLIRYHKALKKLEK